MVSHIMKRWETDIADDMVKMVSPGVFNVDSSTGGYQYTVIYGNKQTAHVWTGDTTSFFANTSVLA